MFHQEARRKFGLPNQQIINMQEHQIKSAIAQIHNIQNELWHSIRELTLTTQHKKLIEIVNTKWRTIDYSQCFQFLPGNYCLGAVIETDINKRHGLVTQLYESIDGVSTDTIQLLRILCGHYNQTRKMLLKKTLPTSWLETIQSMKRDILSAKKLYLDTELDDYQADLKHPIPIQIPHKIAYDCEI